MSNKFKLSKYAELFQDIKASHIMTRDVIVLTPEKKISLAKELMRINKISGIPVVDQEKHLIGIISIEDIIVAVEFRRLGEPVRNMMTAEVIGLNEEDTLSDVVEKFETYKYGRFPVVDDGGVLKGIISREDILNGLLEKFNILYVHDKKRASTLNTEFSIITGETLKFEEAEFHYTIAVNDIENAGTGAALLKQFLLNKGIDQEITRRVGIVTYEAETNVVIHSKGSGDVSCFIHEDRIIVQVVDNGVGIEDLEKAMKEGYSTAPDYVRELGFGAGMGIPNMKRFSDKLVILSEKNVGTQVEMIFFLS